MASESNSNSIDVNVPVFLLGAGRSGTKFIRGLLSASDEVDFIPYDVGFVWRYGNESLNHDELLPEMLTPSIIANIRKTLPKLLKNKGKHSRFFLEKSVPNTLRPSFMYEVFPDAKFIHLIRDGRAVTESSVRMWGEPVEKSYLLKKLKYFPWSNYKYALWYLGNLLKGKLLLKRGQHIWGPRYKGINEDVKNLPLETVCARQWKKSVEICSEQLRSYSSDQVIEVRYEDIMSDPKALLKVCEFLGLTDSDKVLQAFHSTAVTTNMEKWKKSLSSDQLSLIMEEIGSTLRDLGYAVDN